MRLIDFLNRSLWSDLICESIHLCENRIESLNRSFRWIDSFCEYRIESLDNGCCPISNLLCESIHYSFLIRFFYSVDSLVRTLPYLLCCQPCIISRAPRSPPRTTGRRFESIFFMRWIDFLNRSPWLDLLVNRFIFVQIDSNRRPDLWSLKMFFNIIFI